MVVVLRKRSVAMLIKICLLVSLIMTLCLCFYSLVSFNLVKSKTIFRKLVIADGSVPSGDVDVSVYVVTAELLNRIEDYFIGFTIDSQEFGEHFQKMNFRLVFSRSYCYTV